MPATHKMLPNAADGSLVILQVGDQICFGIKCSGQHGAYVAIIRQEIDGAAGPLIIEDDGAMRVVDFGTEWLFDFDPESVNMTLHPAPLGALIITETGPLLMAHGQVGNRMISPNGQMGFQNRNQPHTVSWSVLRRVDTGGYREVLFWPMGE